MYFENFESNSRVDNLKAAKELFNHCVYATSSLIYSWLNQRVCAQIYNTNIILSSKRFSYNTKTFSIGELLASAGVDHTYILNLKRRPDRKLRMALEFSRHRISYDFLSAVDFFENPIVESFYSDHIYLKSSRTWFDQHLTEVHKASLYKALSKGSVAYKLSQSNIINDAQKNGYKRIAVFDDDVFFSSCSSKILHNFIAQCHNNWKIVALGASDAFLSNRICDFEAISNLEAVGFYNPLPGKTCGSFAMLYDSEVFSELIEASNYPSGTFDNTTLGAMYAKYPGECFVLFPNIVTPSVVDSDIRHSRAQLDHSKRMFWDLSGYKRWLSPIEAYVVCEDNGQSLDHDFEFLTEDVLSFRFVSMSEAEYLQMPDDIVVYLSAQEFCQENRICDLMCEKLGTTPSTSGVRRFFLYIK